MASTRSKNTPGDYQLEQKSIIQQLDYNTYRSYGVPMATYLPGNNILTGRIAPENLSSNACDIESQLRGIGSTNLVNPQPEVVPEIKQLQSLNNGDKIPLVMPVEFTQEPFQRPFRGY